MSAESTAEPFFQRCDVVSERELVGFAMAKRGGGMGMGGRGGGMQFGKIGLKLDRMNLHALAERQNEEDVEEVSFLNFLY